MKNYLITTLMLLMLAMTTQPTQAAVQKHRHSQKVATATSTTTPTSTAAASNADATDADAVEAFSDTTAVVAADTTAAYNRPTHYQMTVSPPIKLQHLFSDVAWDDVFGMFFILCIVAIVGLLTPVLIIALILYYINKNRKDKLKLAEMAVRNGQAIPEQLVRKSTTAYDVNLRGGITQVFLGIGLMILLSYTLLGKLGFGIGALVFFVGLGKVVIALIDKHNS